MKLHQYQIDATDFLYANKKSMIFGDMGVGKTAIVLSLLRKLFDKGETKGVLVLAPLRVCQLSWPIEIDRFAPGLTYTFLHGKDKWHFNHSNNVFLMNYEGLQWLYEYLKSNPCPFDVLIMDEISKLKSASTKRFKMIKKLLPLFKRRIGLTGTPAPNSYLDLFSQFYCIDQGETLGKFITHYRDKYFDTSWNGFNFTIKKEVEQDIDKLIAPLVFRIASDNPVPIEYIDVDVKLDSMVMRGYKQLEKESFVQFDNSVVLHGVNAAVTLNKLRQYLGGACYDETGKAINIHEDKIKAVGKIAGNIIVAYSFKHELARLLRAYPDAVDFSSGDVKATLERWNNKEIKMLLVNPAAASHGLNLQYGGHTLVWLTLPWSLEQYLQMNARIWRMGQENTVKIYYILVPNTVDNVVLSVLLSKDGRQQALLQAMSQFRKK